MNFYDYYLIRENAYIKETDTTNDSSEFWNIKKEIGDINFLNNKKNFSKHYHDSFSRCKKWLQVHHPELLL